MKIRKIRRLRWYIAALLFTATVINYIDRQTLSIVAPVLTKELHISPIQYSNMLQAFLIVVLIRIVFSWLSPYPTNPVSRLAFQVTEPILAPIRRRLPPLSGIDLSPLVVWLVVIILIGVLRTLG